MKRLAGDSAARAVISGSDNFNACSYIDQDRILLHSFSGVLYLPADGEEYDLPIQTTHDYECRRMHLITSLCKPLPPIS